MGVPEHKIDRVPLRRRLAPVLLSAALSVIFPATLVPGAVAAETAPLHSALWTAPLAGELRVTRGFDPPAGDYGAGHRGVDLAGARGQPVLAAGGGVVLFAGMLAGRPVISIAHPNGLRTTYEPVDPSVAAGQVVARGSPIGTVAAGHAGCPSDACLHWGLRRGNVYLDPFSLLRPPRVRLLTPMPVVSGA